MLASLRASQDKRPDKTKIPEIAFCEEKNRLRDGFLQSIQELNALLDQQTRAVIDGDVDFSRFDVLLHVAHEKKEMAKYAWMTHVEVHHCEEG
jgi:hypothetical protein